MLHPSLGFSQGNLVTTLGILLAGVALSCTAAAQTKTTPLTKPALSNIPDAAARRAANLQQQTEQQAATVQKLLTEELRMVVRTPYVLAGNLSEQQLAGYFDELIAPSAAAMHRQFFDTQPDAPLTIWLFREEKSYAAHAKRIYGDENVSVYGYYKPDKRALVMNIGTGGGTLVHELTHALAAFDFPGQPDWFNEGLASLYEQSSFVGTGNQQRIVGRVNWRLNRLQEATRAGELPSLSELIQSREFRGANMGRNYAQARYFCLYLQEQGLLEKYYQLFRDSRLTDPTGIDTARAVLGEKAWKTIDADYQRWVLGLQR